MSEQSTDSPAAYDPEQQPCPRCGGERVIGWVPDYDHMMVRRLGWVPGTPKKLKPVFGIQSAGVEQPSYKLLPITAYRCVRCGFLEFYAQEGD